MHKAILFTSAALLLEFSPCYAAEDSVQDEINAYNKADYQQVVHIGNNLITAQPGNETARYYLANAYSKLDLIPEAIQQYNFCARVSNDPTIRSYSKQALSVLNNYQSSSWANPAHFAGASNNAYQMHVPTVQQDEQLIQSQANTLKSQMYTNNQNYLSDVQWEHDIRVAHIQARAAGLNYQLPQNYGYTPYGEPAYNPYYQAGSAYNNARAQLRILDADYHLQNQQRIINQDYSRGVAGVDNSATGLNQQLEGGNGNMQLSPVGTNLYVRNYINYDSAPPPEPPVITGLKAVAKPLSITK